MKLKKILASLTAAALAATTMAFTPLTASAAAVDIPSGTETVLKTFELGDGHSNLSAWQNCWVQIWGIDASYFNSNNYLKFTTSYATAPKIGDGNNSMSEVAAWGWNAYSGWYSVGRLGDDETKNKLVPATNSKDNEFYCYLPTTDFTADDHISGNFYSAFDGTNLISIELVEFSSYTAPSLPDYKYAFDTASGSVDAGTWGQPAKTAVGDGQTITADILGGDFIIKVPYTGTSKPLVVLSDGSGDEGTLNWITVKSEGVVDGVAYFTKSDISSAWAAKGGKSDFSDVTTLFIAAQADALSVSDVVLYSTVAPKVDPESISLDKTELSLKEGSDPVTLTATVKPDDASYDGIDWTSSDTAVATVDSKGNVTPVAEGTATITATISGTTISATCNVTVTSNKPTSIALDKTSLTLTAGGATAKLAATVLPEGAEAVVEWTSSNTAIATVADGVVTPVAAGTATITASIKGTDLSASCAVTVIEDVIKPESITINKTALKLTEGDAPAQLTATVLPEGAEAVVEWSSSNTAVATVDSKGNVTAVAEGKAMITASIKGTDLSASCAVEVVKKPTGFQGAAELPANKVAVQTTAVVDGTYCDRFVMRVSEADIAKASEVVFTLSNGTKTVTYTTNTYYTSLTVNGTKTSAGDGYVLLTLTIKDIPEDVTVTCTKVEIK